MRLRGYVVLRLRSTMLYMIRDLSGARTRRWLCCWRATIQLLLILSLCWLLRLRIRESVELSRPNHSTRIGRCRVVMLRWLVLVLWRLSWVMNG